MPANCGTVFRGSLSIGNSKPNFRRAHFDENLLHTRVNLCLAVIITIAFNAMDAVVLGPELNRIPSMIHMLMIIPILLIGVASTFSAQRHRIYPPLALIASTMLGLGVVAIQIIAHVGRQCRFCFPA